MHSGDRALFRMEKFCYKFSRLIEDQDRGGDGDEEEEVCDRESTRLEH